MKRLYMQDERGILRAYTTGGELVTTQDIGSRTLLNIWRDTMGTFMVVEIPHTYLLIDQGNIRIGDAQNGMTRVYIEDYETFPTLDAALVAAILQMSQTV